MSDNIYLIKGETLTIMADGVRSIFGTSDKYTPEEMASVIAKIEAGLPSLSNPASGDQILNGYEAINEDGEKIIGTIATKTSSNLSASGATVTVPAGYYASNASKSIASAIQATPSISVNANGLVTATTTQTAGYVAAGTKSSTYQLAFQAAKTITPTTSNQIAVFSGYYTGGSVTVQGDSNLVAENIKNGISIFGVNGTYEGSGGGTEIEDGLIAGTLTEYTNDRVTAVASNTFAKMVSVNFPNCTTIGENAFKSCDYLTTAIFPKCTRINSSAFYWCTELKNISFPACVRIDDNAFCANYDLVSAEFPVCIYIGSSAFSNCMDLTNISFPVCSITNDHTFYSCSALTNIFLPSCQKLGSNTFGKCTNLKNIELPMCSIMYNYAFADCFSLITAIFPVCKIIGNYAFSRCSSLTTISFPMCTSISNNAFYSCSSLTTVSFPMCTSIGNYAF